MPIIYFPRRVYKRNDPAIDRVISKRNIESSTGGQDLSESDLNARIYSEKEWKVNSINFSFSGSDNKDFSAYIETGRTIVENLNDYFWFDAEGTFRQKITLTPGFYNGEQLAEEIQTQLTNNTVYAENEITFEVTYDNDSGEFSIATSSANAPRIAYIQENRHQTFNLVDSIAGHVFGFTQNTEYADSIVSDTPVFGLDSRVAIISQSGSDVTSYRHNTEHVLSMDQAISVEASSSSSINANYNIIHEVII